MKSKTRWIVQIVTVGLVAASILAALSCHAGCPEYAAVYLVPENITVTTIIKAPNKGAAWRSAKRSAPNHSTLLNVYLWTPPYPPAPVPEGAMVDAEDNKN